jgi:hypothetical protein
MNIIPSQQKSIFSKTENKREKIRALSLAKECYSMKLDLLTNATVVGDAIRFVSESERSKDKEKEKEKEIAPVIC